MKKTPNVNIPSQNQIKKNTPQNTHYFKETLMFSSQFLDSDLLF